MVYHPNIDLDGNVCLNILREDWKPVLTINSIVYGLQYLFSVREFNMCIADFSFKNPIVSLISSLCFSIKQEPNPEDPLNKEAAEVLQTNRRLFESNVAKAMRGHSVGGTYFECCLK